MQPESYGEAYERPRRRIWPYLPVLAILILGIWLFLFGPLLER